MVVRGVLVYLYPQTMTEMTDREKSIQWFNELSESDKLNYVCLIERPFSGIDFLTGREIELIYNKVHNVE